MFLDSRIKKCLKYINAASKEIDELGEIYDNDSKNEPVKKELFKKMDELENYRFNEYAKVIFEVYSAKKPKLKNIHDGTISAWDDVFDSDFSKLSKRDRNDLICLIEGHGGRYRFK